MTEKIKLVRGDTRPQIGVSLKDQDTGQAINVSGGTVRMLFRPAGTTVLQATVPGVLLVGIDQDDGTVSSAPPYDVAGAGGRVAFLWAPGDLDCDPGDYEAEIEVTFSDGQVQTVYDVLKFKLREDFAG